MAKQSTKAINVTWEKGGDKVEKFNVAGVAPVTPEEYNGAGAMSKYLAANFLAGTVHQSIMAAAEVTREKLKEGTGLAKLLPDVSNADRNAIKTLSGHTPASIRRAWERAAKAKKRVHGATLQALAKAVTPSNGGANAEPLKKRIEKALADFPGWDSPDRWEDENSKALYDILCELAPSEKPE